MKITVKQVNDTVELVISYDAEQPGEDVNPLLNLLKDKLIGDGYQFDLSVDKNVLVCRKPSRLSFNGFQAALKNILTKAHYEVHVENTNKLNTLPVNLWRHTMTFFRTEEVLTSVQVCNLLNQNSRDRNGALFLRDYQKMTPRLITGLKNSSVTKKQIERKSEEAFMLFEFGAAISDTGNLYSVFRSDLTVSHLLNERLPGQEHKLQLQKSCDYYRVCVLQVSMDERRVLLCGKIEDKDGNKQDFYVYNLKEKLLVHMQGAVEAQLSLDGNTVASLDSTRTKLHIQRLKGDSRNNTASFVLETKAMLEEKTAIQGFALSGNGERCVLWRDQSIKLWRCASAVPDQKDDSINLPPILSSVHRCCLDFTGQNMVVAYQDDPQDKNPNRCMLEAFHETNSRFQAGKTIRRRDVEQYYKDTAPPQMIDKVIFSPDGNFVGFTHIDNRQYYQSERARSRRVRIHRDYNFRIWDITTGKEVFVTETYGTGLNASPRFSFVGYYRQERSGRTRLATPTIVSFPLESQSVSPKCKR